MRLNGDKSATRPTTNRPDDGPTRRPVEWITPQEAAEALGISVEAVRGRIKRNTLPHRRDENGAVWVLIGDQTGDQTPENSTSPRDQTGDQTRPDAAGQDDQTTGEARAQAELIAVLKEQLSAEREAHAETRRIAAMLAARVGEIEAPRETSPDTLGAPETATETPEGASPRSGTVGPQDAEETARRPWWVRWFGG